MIGMLALLVLSSLADIDLGDFPDTKASWEASQYPECSELQIPQRYIDAPTDGHCYAATMLMEQVMNDEFTDCVFITNDGWFPATENPMTRTRVSALLASADPY